MQRYTVYLLVHLETALHVSCGISTHHQEHTRMYLQLQELAKPFLLLAAIVEELELQSRTPLVSPIRATVPAHLILLYLITRIIHIC